MNRPKPKETICAYGKCTREDIRITVIHDNYREKFCSEIHAAASLLHWASMAAGIRPELSVALLHMEKEVTSVIT